MLKLLTIFWIENCLDSENFPKPLKNSEASENAMFGRKTEILGEPTVCVESSQGSPKVYFGFLVVSHSKTTVLKEWS